MSDSSLVIYERLTSHYTKGRTFEGKTYDVDTITIHCTASSTEKVTAKETCDYFATTKEEASSTYTVGGDGSVAQSVLEANRAWTTGGKKTVAGETGEINDFHAITIEVASDKTSDIVTDKAIEATIALCVDIMKRHSKTKAVWFGDNAEKMVTYKPAANEMKFTWHRWFAAKACPGAAIMGKMQYIIDSINAQLANTQYVPVTPTASKYPYVILSEEECKSKLWNMLMSEINNEIGIAGLMGNIRAESNFHSNNLQNSYEKSLGKTDEQYTEQVDSGAYTNFVNDSCRLP